MTGNDEPRVEQIHDEQVSGMSRRRLVQTLGALGFAGSAAHITAEDVLAAGSDEVPIVYGFAREVDAAPSSMAPGPATVPRKTTVPADWYNDLQHAFDVHDRRKHEWGTVNGVRSTGVSPGRYGGENASIVVEVLREKAGESRGTVPESADGVPVEVEEVDEGYLLACSDEANYNYQDFGTYVPGGVLCDGPTTGTLECATLAPALYTGSGDDFVTANHVYGGQGTDHQGEPLYHPDEENGDSLGAVEEGHCYDDFIRIDPNSDHEPVSEIEDANPRYVSGQFTKDGLSHLKGLDARLRKWGITTGYTAGYINKIDATTWNYGCTPKDGQLKWGNEFDAKPGDSGSVNYYPDPEWPDTYIMVGGFNNYNTGSEIYGTGAWSVKNHHGFTF